MKDSHPLHVEILPQTDNSIYEQRETGLTHTPFQLEYLLYSAIQKGDEVRLKEAIRAYTDGGFIIGRLSNNPLRQLHYWAIACVSIAIHYAILGGLDETDAYNLSDTYIRHIDGTSSLEDCVSYLTEKAFELTRLVHNSKIKNTSPAIRKCVHYIHIHLHERLSTAQLAAEVGLSRDYLSTLFKKEMGISLHVYILHQKLETSKLMLLSGMTYDDISYQLAFCSETHYITCFKKEYGVTPGVFRKKSYLQDHPYGLHKEHGE